jgi:hypothetical protein
VELPRPPQYESCHLHSRFHGSAKSRIQLTVPRDSSRRGWNDVEVVTDVISGDKSSRGGLDRLMREVCPPCTGGQAVWRGSRVQVLLASFLGRLFASGGGTLSDSGNGHGERSKQTSIHAADRH